VLPQVVQYLPSKYEALEFKLQSHKKKKKERKKSGAQIPGNFLLIPRKYVNIFPFISLSLSLISFT
jgi:hypothetical protein